MEEENARDDEIELKYVIFSYGGIVVRYILGLHRIEVKVGDKFISADKYQNYNRFTESYICHNISDWDYFDYLIEESFSADGRSVGVDLKPDNPKEKPDESKEKKKREREDPKSRRKKVSAARRILSSIKRAFKSLLEDPEDKAAERFWRETLYTTGFRAYYAGKKAELYLPDAEPYPPDNVDKHLAQEILKCMYPDQQSLRERVGKRFSKIKDKIEQASQIDDWNLIFDEGSQILSSFDTDKDQDLPKRLETLHQQSELLRLYIKRKSLHDADGIQQSDNIIAFIVLAFLVAACSNVKGRLNDHLSLTYFIKQKLPPDEMCSESAGTEDENEAFDKASKEAVVENIYNKNPKKTEELIYGLLETIKDLEVLERILLEVRKRRNKDDRSLTGMYTPDAETVETLEQNYKSKK